MLTTLTALRATATDDAAPRHQWLTLAAPAAIYIVVRAAGVLLLAGMSARHGQPLNMHRWDGDWYLAIAQHGYAAVPDTMRDTFGHHGRFTSLAYFPGYPWLVRGVATLLGGHYVLAAVAVSTVAGVVGAYGVARLARHVTGAQRAALITVVLFAAAPMSIVYSMAYPEAVLCALTAWALVGALERRWLLAGLCAAAAGLIHPTAVAVVAVVFAVVAWEALCTRGNWPAIAGALLAPSGLLGYFVWVGNETDDIGGYFAIQRDGWSFGFDGGVATAKRALNSLTNDLSPLQTLAVWVLLAAIALLVISARRLPWPLWAYACLIVIIEVGTSGHMVSKIRELLPASLVLLLPIAAGLARLRATTAVCLTAGYVLAGLWIGAYSLTAWEYGI